MTVAASVGAKAFSVGCTLAQVPLALHYLGAESYGFWVTISSAALVLNFVDFGVGVGMQHAMARAFGNEDSAAMRRVFWTGTCLLAAIGLAVVAVGVPAAFALPWADLLQVRDAALRSEAPAALALSVVMVAAALPFNAVARLAAALQRGWVQAGWIAAGSALSLVLVAAAVVLRWGFLGFLAASLAVPVLQGAGLLLQLLRALGWSLVPSGMAPAAEVRAMLRSSLYFALPQFGQALAQSAPALAISVAAGSSAVTAFNLAARLFSPLQQAQLILLTPVWPAYTEAHARGEAAWISRAFWRTVAATGGLAAGVALLSWQYAWLLRLWIGTRVVLPGARLVALAALWTVLQMAAQPMIYFLVGIGRLRRLAWSATPGFLLASAALFWGAASGTSENVLSAGSIGLAAALILPLSMETLFTVQRGGPGGND